MTKSIEIQIALDDLEFLKTNRYLLCFAAINSGIVWRCFSDYLASNPFSLISQYEVFGTSSLNIGSVITIDTNTVAITPGQQCTLDADAIFHPPTAGGMPEGITINNQYGQPIGVGLSRALIGPDNVQQTTPVFATLVQGPGTIDIMPSNNVRIWLQQDIVTSTIVDPRSIQNSIEVDLGAKDAVRLLYQGGKWSETSGARSNS
ncbi:hypothetical protein UP10_08600 [Bradyrhizobium sp. LTSPM299]|jgi:hypothetical protein|uniref:hypothetical protein n=1 Tax=Bradyrhizobium sp. LTSPM299 TaxID=1619233 RepID=UPI0005CA1F85|nr:hypothetical protein [Bradyrhizobium sp. LTSPM299]KJC60973.1 hypothetical protein UP10_08600 [Bradyrhizobium sp. LTSPM299]